MEEGVSLSLRSASASSSSGRTELLRHPVDELEFFGVEREDVREGGEARLPAEEGKRSSVSRRAPWKRVTGERRGTHLMAVTVVLQLGQLYSSSAGSSACSRQSSSRTLSYSTLPSASLARSTAATGTLTLSCSSVR